MCSVVTKYAYIDLDALAEMSHLFVGLGTIGLSNWMFMWPPRAFKHTVEATHTAGVGSCSLSAPRVD